MVAMSDKCASCRQQLPLRTPMTDFTVADSWPCPVCGQIVCNQPASIGGRYGTWPCYSQHIEQCHPELYIIGTAA